MIALASPLKFKRGHPFHRRSQTETSCDEVKRAKEFQQKAIKMKSSRQQHKVNNISNGKQVQKVCLSIILRKNDIRDKNKIRKMSFGLKNNKQEGSILKYKQNSERKQISEGKDKKVSFALKDKEPLSKINQKRELSLAKQISSRVKNIQFDVQQWRFEVKKICACLDELKNFGLVEKKLNNWCKNYFESKKKGLTDIFMRRLLKKKSLNDEITFIAVNCQQNLLNRIFDHAIKMSEKQRYFLGIEICLYRNFLEEKIANKHRLELHQIQNRVKGNLLQAQAKQLAKELYNCENNNIEITNFFADLQRLEQTYGKLNLVSIKNRKRYQNMNKSESNIRKLIYD